MSGLNRRLKSWPSWLAMAAAVVVLLVVGAIGDTGPLTQQERIDAISRRLACPTCDGESVFVSQASSAEAIRNEVARQVGAGVLDDDEIVALIEDRFGGQVLLVPRADGLDALIWILPMVAGVAAVTGLGIAFRTWRREGSLTATDEDEALVADLLGDRSR
jgi:cytochrome c-type biogenesis protein CcmH